MKAAVPTSPSVWPRVAFSVGLVVLSYLIYWPAIHGAWLWDDGLEIAQNPSLRSASGWWQQWTQPPGMDYFPLKGSLQWLQWQLWAGSAVGFHAVNIALHALSGLLLWRMLTRVGVRFGWVAALVFVVHPMAVESVAWISEQKNEWSLVFLLLAATAYVDFDASGSRQRLGAALGWFALAMLCKSTVAMLPVVILAYAWWSRRTIGRRDWWAALPFFAVALILGGVTVWFQGHRAIGITGPMPPFGERWGQAAWSAWAYLGTLLLPIWLAPIYAPVTTVIPAVVGWLAAIALVVVLALRAGPVGRALFLGLAWIGINLAPILGLVPLSYLRVAPRADHLAYLGIVGVAGLAAGGFGLLARQGRAAIGWLLLAVVTGGFALESHAYSRAFESGETFWREAVRRNPRAWLAQNNLGQIRLEAGDVAAAIQPLELAASLQPDSAEAHANLGSAYDRSARTAEAKAEYESALRIAPTFAGARYDLGLLDLKAGDLAAADRELRKALVSDPRHPGAHNALGLVLAHQGNLGAAQNEYSEALALRPDFPEAELNLGNLYARSGRYDEAITAFRRAIALDPHYRAAHANLGATLRFLGRTQEAEVELKAAKAP